MKTMWQLASLCAVWVALALVPSFAMAQTTPAIQGTAVADPAVPVLVTPAPTGSGFFVLNQDFSLMQHSLVDTSQNQSCTGPGIFSRTNPAPRTLVTDLYNAYFSGPDGPGYNTAIDALTPEVSCTPVQAFDYTGGLATQSLASNDPQHALYYLVSAFGGNSVDQLNVLSNLNNATVSSTNKFTELNETPLDTGGVYTSVVSDTRSDFGLTAVTELKTSTSPGNLWIYYPQTNAVYKILGPGGTPLPAVTSFLIPPQTDGGGSLLVLVNQDGLTSSNISSPPQDTTPFTIIDLGQLRPLLDASKPRGTITLPFVTQIKATTPFYAMLGGAYNPLDDRVYVVVAGGTSTSSVVENVISYDTLNPSTPKEQVVADVSSVPFSLGSYPQLALNAASKTLQILTSNPSAVYTVGISGTGNTAVAVPGSSFPDSNFQPTYIAANPLQGETYIASSSGQVDVLTRPTTLQGGLTLTLTGSDLGYTSQQYQVKPLALWPVYDASLGTAALTITATPDGGTPATLATAHVADVGYPGSSFFTYTFPAAGRYTLVATAAASALYPAVTSPPLYVYVGNTGVYPTAVSLSIPATAAASNGAASLNATVTLSGTTYGPTGQVYIQDTTGAEVGNIQLPKGVLSNPLTIPITIGQGSQTLTAVYSGDDQNQSSKSTPQTIVVGTVTRVTPTFTLTLPATAVAGASVTGNLKFTSTSTAAPTGTVTIYATLSGSTTANQIATVAAAQAFASAGMSFSFTAPAAGTYTVFAGYGGDTNYTNAVSANSTLTVSAPVLQTTTVGIVAPATASPGTAFNVVVGFNVYGAYTTQPTGNIVLTATPAGGSAITLATITPAQGMAPGGANVSVTLPNAGVYTLNATYSGDSLYATSNNTASVTVNGFPTTLKLTAGANQTAGTVFAATIALTSSGSTTIPTGNVVLTAVSGTGSPFTVATITAAQALQSGGYAAQITPTASGTYTLTATYSGDSHFSGSTANTTVTVAAVATTLTLQAPATASPNTPFSAVVQFTPATSAATAPTGNIIITATSSTGTSTVVGALVVSQASGTGGYTAQITLPSAGTYTLKAAYAGDSIYSSASSSVTVTVAALGGTTTMGLSGATTQTAGVAFPLTVRLASQSGGSGIPTGNVVISTLVGATRTTLATVTAAQALATGGYQAQVTLPSAGSFTITATYAGDANFSGSSANLLVTVTLPPSDVSISGPLQALVSTPVAISVSLLSATATGPITVTSTINGVAGPSATVSGPKGTATLTFPAPGVYTLLATYAGDPNNGPGRSDTNGYTYQLTVYTQANVPSFTLAPKDPSLTANSAPIQLTANVTIPFVLTSVNGYSGTTSITTSEVSVDGNVLADLAATENPIQTVMFDGYGKVIGNQSGSVILNPPSAPFSIQFYAGQAKNEDGPLKRERRPLLCILVGGIVLGTLRRRKGIYRVLTVLCVLSMIGLGATVVSGCGNTADTYRVTVQAQDSINGITQTTSFLLTVPK